MKNIKKTIALFAMLFNVFSICNNVNKKPIEANAASKVTHDLITTPENPSKVAIDLFGSSSDTFNDLYIDKNIVNCVITNNKNSFINFDVAHNSTTIEGYPMEVGWTWERAMTLFATDWDTGERLMTDEELESAFKEYFGIQKFTPTKDPRTINNSNESFYLGAYLYENAEDPSKHDLILYADVDAILITSCNGMFKDFNDLENIEFEGCHVFCDDVSHMFSDCTSLTSIDLRGLNFNDKYCITNDGERIPVLDYDFPVKYFKSMFEGCTSLVEVDFPNIPLSYGKFVKEGDLVYEAPAEKIYYRRNLFICESDYTAMFKGCTNLQRVNLSTSYVENANDEILDYKQTKFNGEYIENRDIPFKDMFFDWDGTKENKIQSFIEEGEEKKYIYDNISNFACKYGEMFAGCTNLNVVAFPNIFSLFEAYWGEAEELFTNIKLGVFINSEVENMLNCSLIGNVLVTNSIPKENIKKLKELYKSIYTMDTCHADIEEVNKILDDYEKINSDPDKQNEAFILNNLYYTEGFHKVTVENGETTTTYDKELYFIKAMGKIDYMLSLPNKDGNGPLQNDIITAFISNNYNAFIVIGLVSLLSVIAYYVIEKKKVVNN